MAIFIECSIRTVNLHFGEHTNHTINLDKVYHIQLYDWDKTNFPAYFSIHFVSERNLNWCFLTKDERNAEYKRIMELK